MATPGPGEGAGLLRWRWASPSPRPEGRGGPGGEVGQSVPRGPPLLPAPASRPLCPLPPTLGMGDIGRMGVLWEVGCLRASGGPRTAVVGKERWLQTARECREKVVESEFRRNTSEEKSASERGSARASLRIRDEAGSLQRSSLGKPSKQTRVESTQVEGAQNKNCCRAQPPLYVTGEWRRGAFKVALTSQTLKTPSRASPRGPQVTIGCLVFSACKEQGLHSQPRHPAAQEAAVTKTYGGEVRL